MVLPQTSPNNATNASTATKWPLLNHQLHLLQSSTLNTPSSTSAATSSIIKDTITLYALIGIQIGQS